MSTSKKPGTRRVVKRRTKVAIGGLSQSAFAGYAPASAAGQTSSVENTRKPSAESGGENVSTEGDKNPQGKKKNKKKAKLRHSER